MKLTMPSQLTIIELAELVEVTMNQIWLLSTSSHVLLKKLPTYKILIVTKLQEYDYSSWLIDIIVNILLLIHTLNFRTTLLNCNKIFFWHISEFSIFN